KLAGIAFGEADRLIQPVVEQQAVRQAGEAVVMRDPLDPLFGQLVFRDIGNHGETTYGFASGSDAWQEFDLMVADFAAAENAVLLIGNRMALHRPRDMVLDLPLYLLSHHLQNV